MARFDPIKNSFVSGKMSRRLEGRDDVEQYFQGLRQCRNYIVLPHGGLYRDSGTRFVTNSKTNQKVRFIDFQVSTEASYVIELTNLLARFYTNEGIVGAPTEVVTPWAEADFAGLQWAQSADTMWIVHPDYPPYVLTRTGATSFSIAVQAFTDGHMPLNNDNVDLTNTVTVTGAGPSYTLTFAAAALDTTTDVGRAVRIIDAGTIRWYDITAVSSTTVCTATLVDGTGTPAATADWALGLFSDNSGCNAIIMHEGRLFYGGFTFNVARVAGSESGNFNGFAQFDGSLTTAENDDRAIYLDINDGQVNTVQWLASTAEKLLIGTAGSEFFARGSNNDIMTPTGTVVKPLSRRGSMLTKPVIVDGHVIYAQRTKRTLRRILFNLESDKEFSQWLNLLSEDILLENVVEMAYQQDPHSVLWVLKADGNLVGFTILVDQKVLAAHEHTFNGFVESIAVVPSPNEDHSQLWLAVKRTIDGATERHIEFMEDEFRPNLDFDATDPEKSDTLYDAFFVHSGLTLDDPKTITGITAANPPVVTATAHGFSNGEQVKISGVTGMTEVNRESYLVANVTANTFELQDLDAVNIDGTGFTAYVSGGEAREEVATVSGLDHLEGETVAVLGNGSEQPTQVVSGGAITLDTKAGTVHVGLPYTSFAETQRFIGGNPLGSDQGELSRIHRVTMRVLETLGLKVGAGPNPTTFDDVVFATANDLTNEPPPLFTGDKVIALPSGWTDEPTIYFKQDGPLPSTVLSIKPNMNSNAR
jgi:hypothetical protein